MCYVVYILSVTKVRKKNARTKFWFRYLEQYRHTSLRRRGTCHIYQSCKTISPDMPDKPNLLSENNQRKVLKKLSKRHQEWALLKIFPRRPQIPEFCACKHNLLTYSRLSRFFAICAVSESRKTAFSGQNVRIFSAVRASRGHDGAAFVVQRGRCCNTVRPPPEPREALMAKPARFRHTSSAFPAS